MAGSSASGMPGVDVEHVGAGLDLGQDVALDPAEVAVLHLLGQQLPAGRVDPLADDHERLVRADHDRPAGRPDDGPGHDRRRIEALAAGRDQAGQDLLGVLVLEPAASALASASRSSPHGRWVLPPLGDVGVHLAPAGLDRRLVDRDLEAWMEDDLRGSAGILGDDLGRDVAPPDDGQGGHQAALAAGLTGADVAVASAVRVWASSPSPVARSLVRQAQPAGSRGRAAAASAGSSVWAR